MESPLSFFRLHWDHEPGLARSAGFRACGFGRLSSRPFFVHRTGKSGKPAGWKACPTFRFMESRHDFHAVHGDHEPQTSWTVPPTRCCRRLVGRGSFRISLPARCWQHPRVHGEERSISGTSAHGQGLPDWIDTPKLANADLCTAPFRHPIRRHQHQRNKPGKTLEIPAPLLRRRHCLLKRSPSLLQLPALNPQPIALNPR